jgi:hypothetical protein
MKTREMQCNESKENEMRPNQKKGNRRNQMKANQLKGNQTQSKETKGNDLFDSRRFTAFNYGWLSEPIIASFPISIFGSVGSALTFRSIAVGMIAHNFCQSHNCMSALASSGEYKKLKSHRSEREIEIAAELHMILTFRKLEIESRLIGINQKIGSTP